MTTRRFNYTKQVRIAQSDVYVSVNAVRPPTAMIAVSLEEYGLPRDAPVVVEAYADWTQSRFEIGTVGRMLTSDPLVLTDFDSADGIRFRVKVLGTGVQSGLILAEADRISPVQEQTAPEGRSFVRVRSADTGHEVWRLRIDEAGPVVELSDKLPDWRSSIRSDAFRALVLPSVLRSLLKAAVGVGEEEEAGGWTSDAIRLGRSLARSDAPAHDDADALDDWCDEACSQLAKNALAIDAARSILEGSEE
jgi:hypothetical protein